MSITTAMILAAGRGERMRPLTDETPKPLLRCAGQTLIDRQLVHLSCAGVREVVINLAWLGDRIRAHVGDGEAHGLTVRYSEEPEGALESGGGIVQALPLIESETFLVVNADVYHDFDLRQLALAEGDLAQLVLVDNPSHHPEGDFALLDGRVATSGAQHLTFAGIGAYRRALFDGLAPGRFPLAPILRQAMGDGRVGGCHHRGRWCDVGTPERLNELQRTVEEA